MATARPCLLCGAGTTKGSYCSLHSVIYQMAWDKRRGTAHQRGYNADYYHLRDKVIALQPWCSICMTTESLTVDHITPLSRGGSNSVENLRVLCAAHNRLKGGR